MRGGGGLDTYSHIHIYIFAQSENPAAKVRAIESDNPGQV